MYQIGASIRVSDASRKSSRRSIIAYFSEGSNTYDLVDEDNVAVERIQRLEPFEEAAGSEQSSVTTLKVIHSLAHSLTHTLTHSLARLLAYSLSHPNIE